MFETDREKMHIIPKIILNEDPLEATNTSKKQNSRLGFIESVHVSNVMVQHNPRPLAPVSAELYFQTDFLLFQNESIDLKRPENIMMYGETFYGHHTAQHQLQ